MAKLLETTAAFAQTIVGTPYYLSPELCSDQPYGDKSDVWALGVVLYECCTLRMPFEAYNQCALILKIIEVSRRAEFSRPSNPKCALTNSNAQGKYEPVRPIHVSAMLCKLVSWLLTKEPLQRPSISDILSEVRKRLMCAMNSSYETELRLGRRTQSKQSCSSTGFSCRTACSDETCCTSCSLKIG